MISNNFMVERQTEHQKNLSNPSTNHAFWVGLGIFLSRISGLFRNRVLAYYLGNSAAAGAFRAAMRIPNILQNLFGEGVLSASFIPVYSKLLADDEQKLADRVAGVVGGLLAVSMAVFVLLGVLLTPAFVDLVAPGFTGETRKLTIELVRILFPGVGLLVLSAWCLGILNSHRKFFLSYVAPVVWNGAMIVALVIGAIESRTDFAKLTVYLAWGAVLGALLQFLVQLPYVCKLMRGWHWSLDHRISHVREIFKNSVPIVISRGVVQLSAYIDGIIGSFLGPSAVSSLAFAQTIYLLPVSLFGMSVAAAELPEMSSADHDHADGHAYLKKRVTISQRRMAFFVAPSAVLLIFLGNFAVEAIYQTGHFTANDTLYVWYVVMGAAIGISASTWSRLYQSAFYALRDTKTPLKFAVVRVVLTAFLGWLFAFPLRDTLNSLLFNVLRLHAPDMANMAIGMGAVGLTASAGIASYVEFGGLRHFLNRKIGGIEMPYAFLAKVWGSALAAAAVVIGLSHAPVESLFFFRLLRARVFHYNFTAAFWLAVFALLYLIFTWSVRVQESQRLIARLLRR